MRECFCNKETKDSSTHCCTIQIMQFCRKIVCFLVLQLGLLPLLLQAQTRDTVLYGCDSLVVNGRVYYSDENGSVVNCTFRGISYRATLHVVDHRNQGNSIKVCNRYQRPGTNIVYTHSTTWNDTTYSVVAPQCDSIIYVNTLTVYPVGEYETTTSACDSYRWSQTIGGIQVGTNRTYLAADTVTHREILSSRVFYPEPNVYCELKDTLHLTLYPSFHDTTRVDACDHYYWDRQSRTYYYSGIYSRNYRYESVWGCDSVYAIDLQIHPNYPHAVENRSGCDSYTWNRNNETYTSSTSVDANYQSVWGCDSNYHLNLTLGHTTYKTIDKQACNAFYWDLTGQTYTHSTTVTHTIRNRSGCDSIVTLNLTVIQAGVGPTTTVTRCGSYTWPETGQTYTVSGTYPHNISTGGLCDSTVFLNLTINPIYNFSDNVTRCDSYTWPSNGQTYTSSTTAQYVGTSVMGCDSVRNLSLTVKHSTAAPAENHTACETYWWANRNWTSSGIFHDTIPNRAGCDSVRTLNLTINHNSSGSETVTECDSYTWQGTTYTASGTHTKTLRNSVNCDSMATLYLTIHHSYTRTDTKDVCDSFFWAGNATLYRNSTHQEVHYTSPTGCDSTLLLDLTVRHSTVAPMVSQEACDSYHWSANNHDYTTSGIYRDVIPNSEGCDSAVSLDLTVKYKSYASIDTVDACEVYTWAFNGRNYTQSGMYGDTTVNAVGCDSIVALKLAIHHQSIERDTVVACESYVWPRNGQRYTQSTRDTIFQHSQFGCDSILVLLLTVNYGTTAATVDTSVCDHFVWSANQHDYAVGGYYFDTLRNANAVGCDSAVSLQLEVRYSTSGADVLEVCDSIVWNGTRYTASGNYTVTLQNAVQCDSIVGLQLTVHYSDTTKHTIRSCDSLLWNGHMYYASGSYADTFATVFGCDSVVRLDLTVPHSTTAPVVDTSVCDRFHWNLPNPHSHDYTIGGFYQDTILNVAGCDSAVSLQLEVRYSTTGVDTQDVCDIYVWNDNSYTTSGDYVDTLVNAVQCDSVVGLNLTVRYSCSTTVVDTACDVYYWFPGKPPYTEIGVHTYIDTMTNVAGCDSIRTLHLALGATTNDTTTVVSCDRYTWQQSRVEYMYSGVYMDSLKSIFHCDSVLSLDLTVHYSSAFDTFAVTCDSLRWYGVTYTEGRETDISHHFSISHIDLVYFAPGNLQYNAASHLWRFAAHQYDRIGASNNNIGPNYNGWIDLFGWGTSGWNSGAVSYQPYDYSVIDDEYYPGGDFHNDLRDSFALADWGAYNPVSNYAPGWGRTLTANEWLFMLYERDNAERLRAPATINGVAGLMLLPDNWILPSGISLNTRAFSYAVNTYSLAQWATLEQAGAVFLPAAGMRLGSRIYDVGQQGYYWSATHGDAERSGYVSFVASGIISGTATDYRSDGLSVRLVHDTTGATARHTFYGGNSQGCDSVNRLHLTVIHTIMGDTTNVEICDSYTWEQNSRLYDTSGIYFDTMTSIMGCDSVLSLDLIVNYSQQYTTIDTACDSYLWNDSLYTLSGIYGMHLRTTHNCDSLDSLYLTLRYSTTDTTVMNTCDSYYWNDSTYLLSGFYYQQLVNAVGCDSNDYLDLVLRYSTADTQQVAACDSFYWHIPDINYLLSGWYRDTIPNSVGCDSVVNLDLTLYYADTNLLDTSVCDQFVWNDSLYTLSGNYQKLLATAHGCDSLDLLHLAVRYSTTDTVRADVCDSYVWNGITIGHPGLFDTVLTNTAVCDSIDVLLLSLRYSTRDSVSVAVCDQYLWPISGETYTQSGVYCDTIPNSVQCDSAIALNLTVNYASSHDTAVAVCDQLFWNGRTLTTSGTYSDMLRNRAGCDSIDSLRLTVSTGFYDTSRVTSCDYYDWRGARYATDGLFAVLYTNFVGCDSIYYLSLALKHSSFDTLPPVHACDHYLWNRTNTTYALSGLYADTVANAAGCDSVTLLPLKVDRSVAIHDSVAACQQYFWPISATTYTSSLTDVVHFQTAAGCDSARYLHLTILQPSSVELFDTICQGQYVAFNNRLCSETGRYVDSLRNRAGCDSVVTLNLWVRQLFDPSFSFEPSCATQRFSLEVADIAPYLHWSAEPADAMLQGHESEPQVFVSPRSSTRYTLTADYAPAGVCPTEYSLILDPIERVTVELDPSTTAFTPTDREISIYSTTTGATYFRWFVDTLFYTNTPNLHYTAAADADSITFKLVASNDYCADSAYVIIPSLDGKLFIPSVFTPNLETNSTFFVQGISIVEYHISIFDRRGDLMFESSDILDPWNGRHHNNGEPCVQASYVYSIHYRTLLHPDIWYRETGSVLLLR